MFYAATISASPQEDPPRFDPLMGRRPGIRHLPSGQVSPAECGPHFIDMGGRRSTISGWRAALRFGLRAAYQEVGSLGELSDLCGLDLRPGRGYPNASYHPELDASVPSLSTGGNAQALFRLLDGLGRTARIRVSSPKGDLLVEHRPQRPAPKAPTRPAPTQDQMIAAARRGEVSYGSFVEISVEGLFDRRVFRLGDTGSDPRRGGLSVCSPVGKSLLGLLPGAESEYATGPVRRRISLHAVDNRHVLRSVLKTAGPDLEMICENKF